ncbi:hypothetical protein ACQJBY_013414 [Aegilops geniculata]
MVVISENVVCFGRRTKGKGSICEKTKPLVRITGVISKSQQENKVQVVAFMVGVSSLAWYHAQQSHGMYHQLHDCQSWCSVPKMSSMVADTNGERPIKRSKIVVEVVVQDCSYY